MELGPVTTLDKKKKTILKNIDGNAMLTNCDVNLIFPIYGQFGATQTPYFPCIVC